MTSNFLIFLISVIVGIATYWLGCLMYGIYEHVAIDVMGMAVIFACIVGLWAVLIREEYRRGKERG